MPASKIVDHTEVLRWFREGRSYRWMVDTYLDKYNIETTIAMWSNFRARHGLPKRSVTDEALMPWRIRPEHYDMFPAYMLRFESRRRAGRPLSEEGLRRLRDWKEMLSEHGVVVHYDADTDAGWFYVPREPEDDDLIRRPLRPNLVEVTDE